MTDKFCQRKISPHLATLVLQKYFQQYDIWYYSTSLASSVGGYGNVRISVRENFIFGDKRGSWSVCAGWLHTAAALN